VTLSEIVQEASELCTDTEEAVKHILKKATGNPIAIKEIKWHGASAVLYKYRQSIRRQAKGKATLCRRGTGGLAVAAAAASEARDASQKHSLLEMVVNGSRFGDMTGEEVLAMAKKAHTDMLGQQLNRDFYTAVGRKAGKKRVDQVFTDKKLEGVLDRIKTKLARTAPPA